MKVKEKKRRAEVPFDPVLFAASVPARKPTAKDIADAKEHKDDLIEPQDVAWQLSEDIKSTWWAQNKNRFTP